MRYRYDLHIHSALSPCAEEEMTPVTIVGQAALSGLDFVAVADHNAIGHVPLALRAGEEFGVTVVPAATYEELEAFFRRIPVSERKNRADLFGEQLYFDEDDNVIGHEERMLLDSAAISCDDVRELAFAMGGIAVPAHIDRDANSMLNILGAVPAEYPVVELSSRASEETLAEWSRERLVIVDSDAHILDDISARGEMDLPERSASALVTALRCGGKE